jgi:hypothetical protein
MARPPINAKGELLFRQQLNGALDYVEALSGGGVSDGDKGDITVSGGGTVWTIDSGAVSAAEITGLAAIATSGAAADLSGTKTAAFISDLAATVQAYTLDTFADPVASVDFGQQQALRMRIENRTSDPGAPATGEIWLRTDL